MNFGIHKSERSPREFPQVPQESFFSEFLLLIAYQEKYHTFVSKMAANSFLLNGKLMRLSLIYSGLILITAGSKIHLFFCSNNLSQANFGMLTAAEFDVSFLLRSFFYSYR